MTIYEINKIFSSENKSRLITHFWDCYCEDHDVRHMAIKLGINESNLSKHIAKLLQLGVLQYKQINHERFYSINKKWKAEWQDIVKPQIFARENRAFTCSCSCHK